MFDPKRASQTTSQRTAENRGNAVREGHGLWVRAGKRKRGSMGAAKAIQQRE